MNACPRKSRSARMGGLIAGLNRIEELQEFRSCRMEGRIPRGADVPTKVPKTPRNHHHGNNPVHTRSVRRWTFNIVNGILRARATPGQRLRLRRSGEILFGVSQTARLCPGGILTCWADAISPGGKLEDSVRIKPPELEA